MSLTPDQAAAAEGFRAWLEGPADGRPFVLAGYAGTGKTFLSMRLLALAEEAGLCWTVVAPTHKAVGVLRRQLELTGLRPTWYPSTIHRLLRLKLRREGDRERCEETSQTATALEHLALVLIDEASMVDSELLEVTLRCAHPYRTRLVFVGDPAQLPPVGEATSPVFALQRACRRSLTHVVRHAGPVLRLATGLREGDLPCRRPPTLPPLRTPEGTVALLDRADWLVAAQAALHRSAETDDPDLARILCYTNRSLERLVPIARRALHGEMADQLPVLPGEVLITRAAVMAPACREGGEEGEEPDLVLGSNRELLVRDVAPERCDLAEFGLAGAEAAVIDTLVAEVDSGGRRMALRLLPPIGSAARTRLEEVLEALRGAAREAARQQGRAGRSLWRRFFTVRDAFASLGPAAVLTVHRSQGSTFGEVFVDADVFWPRDETLRRQLVYVAVSRASHGVSLAAAPGPRAEQELWRRWLTEEEPLDGPLSAGSRTSRSR
ncbi:MAG: AAA family ATPase [Synechococcaceae cyanobacterium]|nr:AAA family ATPase [Synechococcaceae cyanobacterium]